MTYVDIAANLSDDMFTGVYHGKSLHESDLELVLERLPITHAVA